MSACEGSGFGPTAACCMSPRSPVSRSSPRPLPCPPSGAPLPLVRDPQVLEERLLGGPPGRQAVPHQRPLRHRPAPLQAAGRGGQLQARRSPANSHRGPPVLALLGPGLGQWAQEDLHPSPGRPPLNKPSPSLILEPPKSPHTPPPQGDLRVPFQGPQQPGQPRPGPPELRTAPDPDPLAAPGVAVVRELVRQRDQGQGAGAPAGWRGFWGLGFGYHA